MGKIFIFFFTSTKVKSENECSACVQQINKLKMKKFKLHITLAIVAICLLSVVFNSNAQMPEFNSLNDCGHWEIDSIITTSWKTTDTINYNPNADTTWVFSNWQVEFKNYTTLVFCPCGCGYDTVRYMDRISSVGIRQRRFEITKYKYYPKLKSLKSEYEQKLDDILNNHEQKLDNVLK